VGSSQVHLDIPEVTICVRLRFRILRARSDGRFWPFPQDLGFRLNLASGIGPREIRVKELRKSRFIGVRNGMRKRRVCLGHIWILTEHRWRGSSQKDDRHMRAESSHVHSPGLIHAGIIADKRYDLGARGSSVR
jgi:hypothetical protein